MKNRFLVALIALFSVIFPAASQSVDYQSMADKLYADGKYKEAAAEYAKIGEERGTSAQLLYNTGNSYVLSGEIGKGRLFLERARKLSPRNHRINNNLDFVANSVNDANEASRNGKKIKVVPDEISFFAGVDQAISYNIKSNVWSIYALMSFLLLIASLALYLFSRNVNARKAGFFGSLIFLFFSIAFVIFAFMAARAFERHDEAVMIEYKTELRAEPSADAKVVGTPLNQGTKFKILEQETDPEGKVEWYKVRLNSDFIGWIPSGCIEII